MALLVAFAEKTALSALPGYAVWSYTLQPADPSDIVVGQTVALGLPGSIDVRNPQLFPTEAALAGTFVEQNTSASRQLVGRVVTLTGTQTLSFVAPDRAAATDVQVFEHAAGKPWQTEAFSIAGGGSLDLNQKLTGPAAGTGSPPASSTYSGRPAADFSGTLPYASELFGVYQPLAGWLGRQSVQRAGGTGTEVRLAAVRDLAAQQPVAVTPEVYQGQQALVATRPELARITALMAQNLGWLSPVGLINLFRQYFFEFDNFLGSPAGHIWISPGGTVEVIETSTRRTIIEATTEQSETTDRKVEESLTDQDDVADAVKEENSNDTKLGVSATGGVNMGVYHGEASASLNSDSTVKRSSEETHKRSRTQSSKVSSEITRNFKTTFKTTTDNTDTTSRRYLVQNTTDQLVNYELRRKMRKVGVQVQHIGTRLSWQVYLDAPGLGLGMGDLVHLIPEPDLSSIKKPDVVPVPAEQTQVYHLSVPFEQSDGGGPDNDQTYTIEDGNQDRGISKTTAGENNIIQFWFSFPLPPPPAGFTLSKIGPLDFHGAAVSYVTDNPSHGSANPDPVANTFSLRLTTANFGGNMSLPFDATMIYEPSAAAVNAANAANAAAQKEYDDQVAILRHEAYVTAIRDRLKLVSGIKPRPSEDLRSEERQVVYGNLIGQLELTDDRHLDSELIRQIFDVDEMLYFAVPDYWNTPRLAKKPDGSPVAVPATQPGAIGRYPIAPAPPAVPADPNRPLEGDVVASWYSVNDRNNPPRDLAGNPNAENRIDYLVTEETQPAPMGSSLGWLIQIDGDERRNEFLNAAWVKAVLPVRPGHEIDALDWLSQADVEGETALTQEYEPQPGDPADWQGKTLGYVLRQMATTLAAANTDMTNTLASEKVFEHGFDPLEGGFRPAEPYQIFDQWVEVLPTDQIVAVAVDYDPRNGQML